MRLLIALLVALLVLLAANSGMSQVVLALFTAADRAGYALAALVLVAAGVYVHRALAGVTPQRRAVPA